MKLKLLSLLVGAAVVAPSAMADVQVYGKLNASVESTEEVASDGVDRAWEVKSNASRFGVKGDAELTDSLKAIYKLEWQVDISDKANSSDDHIKSRNQYVGLKGGFGQMVVGRHDTPLKSSQGKVDLFGDLGGDIAHIMVGENRKGNMILYTTPKLGDMVTINAAIMPGEGHGTDNDGIADSFSTSVVLETGPVYAAIAYDDEVGNKVPKFLGLSSEDLEMLDNVSGSLDTIRLTAQYNADSFGVGGLYQTAEQSEGNDDSMDSLMLSAYFKVGAGQIEAQYAQTEFDIKNASDEPEIDQITFGYEHKLGKKTKGYVYVTRENYEAGRSDEDITNFGVGVEHKF
jgi:predicted porin